MLSFSKVDIESLWNICLQQGFHIFNNSSIQTSSLSNTGLTGWTKEKPLWELVPRTPKHPQTAGIFFQDTIQDALPSVRCDMRNVAHVAPVKGMRLPSWMIIPEWLRSKLLANDCYNHWKSISIVHQPYDYNSHYYKYPIDSLLF